MEEGRTFQIHVSLAHPAEVAGASLPLPHRASPQRLRAPQVFSLAKHLLCHWVCLCFYFFFFPPSTPNPLHPLSEYIRLPFAQIYGLGQCCVYLQSPDLQTYSWTRAGGNQGPFHKQRQIWGGGSRNCEQHLTFLTIWPSQGISD